MGSLERTSEKDINIEQIIEVSLTQEKKNLKMHQEVNEQIIHYMAYL